MSWNGAGSFNRLYSWVADKAGGLNISSARMDADSNDIAANGFGNSLTRDGQGQPSANLPMANFRHTGVGNGVARNDYAALGQVQDNIINWAVAVGTPDAITATLAPPISALVDGQLTYLRAAGANTTSAPTFAPNGLTARPSGWGHAQCGRHSWRAGRDHPALQRRQYSLGAAQSGHQRVEHSVRYRGPLRGNSASAGLVFDDWAGGFADGRSRPVQRIVDHNHRQHALKHDDRQSGARPPRAWPGGRYC